MTTGTAATATDPAPRSPEPPASLPADVPGWRDSGLRALLALTLLVELTAWFLLEGYYLADVIEYVDLSQRIVREGGIEPDLRRLRPPAFPLFWTPLTGAWEWLGIEDERPLFLVARAVQCAIGLLLVAATVRLGARFAGRRAGLAAGFFVAFNPVFLRHCVDPLTGPLAAALLAFGVAEFLERGPPRRAFRGGLLLGLASLVAYKVLPFVALFGVVLFARDRFRQRASWSGLAGGMLVALALGVLLDRIVYGSFGLSLANYVVYNFTVVAVPFLFELGLDDAARSLFELAGNYYGIDASEQALGLEAKIEQHLPLTWYLTELPSFLVSPVLVVALGALVLALREPRWRTWLLLLSVLGYAAILSGKHSKSFRLFLPVLPLLAVLAGQGWAVLAASGSWRRAVGWLFVAATPVLGVLSTLESQPHRFGHHWQAADWLQARSAEGAARLRFATEYEFGVRFRLGPEFEHVRLRRPLSSWPTGSERDVDVRQAVLEQLESLDWLLVTQAGVERSPRLAQALSARFSVEAAFLETEHLRAQGALFVLRRRGEGGRRFLRLSGDGAPARAGFERPQEQPVPGEREVLTLVDFRFELLPGSELGWVTWRWRTPTGVRADARLGLRTFAADGHPTSHTVRDPAYGLLPISSWSPGRLVETSFLAYGAARGLRKRPGEGAAVAYVVGADGVFDPLPLRPDLPEVPAGARLRPGELAVARFGVTRPAAPGAAGGTGR